MRIERISIKAATVAIFGMVGLVAIVLSLLAGTYFRQAALDAQIGSLSRVIEVAAQETLRELTKHTLELGMKLGHSDALIAALGDGVADRSAVVALLDDPFINGFVGYSDVNLVKLRAYGPNLELFTQSDAGLADLERHLPGYLAARVAQRSGTDRLKALDALWLSSQGPLHSTLVPVGGLRPVGYLEVVVDPAFNLADVGRITRTPVRIFSISDAGAAGDASAAADTLPVEYRLATSDGEPAFRIVGYEDVTELGRAMRHTQRVTTSGFLLLTLGTLLFALWLFNGFLFAPLGRMVKVMDRVAHGKLDQAVDKRALREFSHLAESFELMAHQVRVRTGDLERLLDLDDSAILCFGHDGEAVYFNKGATALFGYAGDELDDLELGDLFRDDLVGLMGDDSAPGGTPRANALHAQLTCVRKDGREFLSDAVVNPLEVTGGFGYTIVLNPVADDQDERLTRILVAGMEQNEQRMRAVEHSLNSILEIARGNPGLVAGLGQLERPALPGLETDDDRLRLREQVVRVMRGALACWEHDLGRTKLELAEASGIWPVYIDKSTPTTRTLDKYLQVDSCPRNPRAQRVVDTAEFVLKQMNRKTTQGRRQLQQALDEFRLLLSGLKAPRG